MCWKAKGEAKDPEPRRRLRVVWLELARAFWMHMHCLADQSRLRFGSRLMAACANCRISPQLLEHA